VIITTEADVCLLRARSLQPSFVDFDPYSPTTLCLQMSTQLFLASLAAIVSLAHCGNFTVTDEAWFEVEIKDMDGPGQDYRWVLLD